ncbi:MAG TPA: HAMP domain-containing histidine kinase [Candidatus Aminicenantes bacterium]|nr:HAMP domain-containing histidine kinase [Candidatus Aminicenantes bacterium]
MRIFGPRLKISLYTRFIIAITFILIFLVGSILFLIERREVRTIFEESKSRGVLTARHIASLNLESLTFWDAVGIKNNIERKIDDSLIYVVIYDKFRSPYVVSDHIRDNEEIWRSRLPEKVSEEMSAMGRRDLRLEGKTVPIIEIEVPVYAEGTQDYWGSVKVGLSLEENRKEIRQTRLMLILIGCGGFLLGLIGAVVLAKRITGPLQKLVEGTVRISKGDFTQTISVGSRDEIGDLARSFNEMTRDLLETRRRMEDANLKLIQAEKLASIGRISASIAHEIRNPLTSVKLNIQKLMQNEHLDEEEKEHLSISQEGIGQIEKFIKELLNFTRVSDLNPERFSVVQIVEESLKMMRNSFQEKKIVLEKNFAADLPSVVVDGDKIRQVFLNILRNAVEAVEEGGKIGLALSRVKENGVARIKVRISDDGCGIPEKDWENIFEPFYTTKPSGFGLGLSNARKIVEQHRGSLRVTKTKGKGTTFEVRIPCEVET